MNADSTPKNNPNQKKISLIKLLAIAILHTSRLQLGFWQAPVCLFEETCTYYSHRQIEEHSLPVALCKITWRLIRCNPITGIFRKIKSYFHK